MFQKVKVYVTVLVTLLAISLGLSVKAGAAEDLAVTKTSIVVLRKPLAVLVVPKSF